MEILEYLTFSFIIAFACFYVSAKIFKTSINYKSFVFWGLIIVYTAWLSLTYNLGGSVLKVFANYLVLSTLNKILFKKGAVNVLAGTFLTIFLFIIAEIIYSIIVVLVLNIDLEEFKDKFSATLISNISIAFISCIMINIKKIMFSFNKLIADVNIKFNKTIILILLLSMLTIVILIYNIYYDASLIVGMIFNLILILMYTFLVLFLLREKNYSSKLQDDYDVLIDNLNEFEKMLEKQRINNHENKNHLIAIKGMLGTKNKEIIKYIDNIIETKKVDDQNLLFKTKRLPIGGLQGLIYQKLLIMKEKEINFNLQISKSLDKKILTKSDVKTNYNLCTIIGVELDNAIEAVENLKTKNISIDIYSRENELVISVSNNFEGSIDLEKIDNKGYSTKGKGRGYGLSLVKQILEKDKNIVLERQIIGNIFKQILKIKI